MNSTAQLGARETLVTHRLGTVEYPSMRELVEGRCDDDLYIRVGTRPDSGWSPDHPFPFRLRFIVPVGMGKVAGRLGKVG